MCVIAEKYSLYKAVHWANSCWNDDLCLQRRAEQLIKILSKLQYPNFMIKVIKSQHTFPRLIQIIRNKND